MDKIPLLTMSPSEIKKILSSVGGFANKRLGQHFLIDDHVLRSIIQTADLHQGDRVLEIGPGLGVLTSALIEQGATVIAVEKDRRFVEYLTSVIPVKAGIRSMHDPSVAKVLFQIHHADATKLQWSSVVGSEPWKFVSNLPYAISSYALRQALWAAHPPEKVVVLVQREVAERALAKKGKQSLLSLMVALRSSAARIIHRVPRGAFYPAPKVESALVEVIPMAIEDAVKKWGTSPERVMEIAKKGFAHPRKLLASNIAVKDHLLFPSLGISEKARAEDVTVEQWAALSKALTSSV